jgi:hypothetical protein
MRMGWLGLSLFFWVVTAILRECSGWKPQPAQIYGMPADPLCRPETIGFLGVAVAGLSAVRRFPDGGRGENYARRRMQ